MIWPRIAVCSVLVLALTASVAGEPRPPVTLSLRQAVKQVLAENPRVRLAAASRDASVARRTQARSAWLPQIRLSETWTRGDNPVYVFGSLLEQGRFGVEHFDPAFLNDPPSLENFRLTLQVAYPLFDQLRRWSLVEQAEIGVEQADLQTGELRQMLRYRTIEAYDGVRIAEAALGVARQAVRAAEADVESIRDRVEVGLLVQSELLAAEVQLSEMHQQEIAAEGNLSIARASLHTLLNLPSGQPLILAGGGIDRGFAKAPVDEWLEAAASRRPDLRRSDLGIEAADLGVRIARGAWLPRVDTFGTIGSSGSKLDEHNGDRVWGISLSLDLLQPGRRGRLAEAHAAKLQAEAQREILADDAELEIIAAWERWRVSEQRLDVARRSLDQASEAVRIISDRYQEGLTTITELLRGRTALVRAEMNLLGARSDYNLGYANLLRATGRLDDVDAFE
ncbi:MAG TPA: TolC family protein [Thermoanaerobaculia bacterium]|nr:TolC family protein [Thermoanaerobaculia bacterium]